MKIVGVLLKTIFLLIVSIIALPFVVIKTAMEIGDGCAKSLFWIFIIIGLLIVL